MAQVNITVDSELLKGLFTAEGRDEAWQSGKVYLDLSAYLCEQGLAVNDTAHVSVA
jgi:hypothetical protein